MEQFTRQAYLKLELAAGVEDGPHQNNLAKKMLAAGKTKGKQTATRLPDGTTVIEFAAYFDERISMTELGKMATDEGFKVLAITDVLPIALA